MKLISIATAFLFGIFTMPVFSAPIYSDSKGPSFDCAKASTRIEHEICEDSYLSDLDLELSRVWKEARNQASPFFAEDAKETGRNWLERDRAYCAHENDDYDFDRCLTRAYHYWTTALSAFDFSIVENNDNVELQLESMHFTGSLDYPKPLQNHPEIEKQFVANQKIDMQYSIAGFADRGGFNSIDRWANVDECDNLLGINVRTEAYCEGCNHGAYYGDYYLFDLKQNKRISIVDLFKNDEIESVRNVIRAELVAQLDEIDMEFETGFASAKEVDNFGNDALFESGAALSWEDDNITYFSYIDLNDHWGYAARAIYSDLTVPFAKVIQFVKPEYQNCVQ